MAKTNNDFLMANYDYDNDYVSPESALYSEDPNTGHPNLENIQVPKILYSCQGKVPKLVKGC